MGKSAKLHKRVPKKSKSSGQSSSALTSTPQAQAQHAQKKASRRAHAKRGGKSEGPVLGGADYVTLMMGGRRKAKEEATKLPPDES